MKKSEPNEYDFYALKFDKMWHYFRSESIAFWMICGYLFVEYVRPQSIIPAIDILPWAKVFLIGSFLGLLFEKKRKWTRSVINKWIILYFLAILLSSMFAYWSKTSFENLDKFYLWLIIYFLIINIVNTKKRLFIFLCIFLIASFKLSASLAKTWALRGFSFTGWGLSGPPGFFQNSGELAIQMAVFWPLALAFTTTCKPYVEKWKYLVLISMPITACMVILGASSRGGQLAMVVQFLFKYLRRIFNLKIIISILTILATAWWFLPEEQKARFSMAGEDTTSIQRLYYWEKGFEMMNDHPLLGVGHFNFIPYYAVHYPEYLLRPTPELAHNIFVQVGADLGYVGLTIYLALIISAYRLTKKIARESKEKDADKFLFNIASALNISLIGFVIAGQFVSVVYYPFLWIHIALVVCLNNVLCQEVKKPTFNKELRKVRNGIPTIPKI